MGILSRLLSLLRIGSNPPPAASKDASPPIPGALAGPPELVSVSEEGAPRLVLFVDRVEVLPLGSQVLRVAGVHRGLRVGLEVVFGPDWREGAPADPPRHEGLVTFRSVGPESDALLEALDEVRETKTAPGEIAGLIDFACVTLGGDPRDLRTGPVHAKLSLEGEGEGDVAELQVFVDVAARRLELRVGPR